MVSTLMGKSGAAYQVYIGGNTSKEGELGFSFLDAQSHEAVLAQ
jgi:sulfite reductase beta subunit-like hemoprotein